MPQSTPSLNFALTISPLQLDAVSRPINLSQSLSIPKVAGRSHRPTPCVKLSNYVHPDDKPPSPVRAPTPPPDDGLHYESRGRRVRQPKSRIARPRDAMPGFKRRRHAKPSGRRSGRFSAQQKNGTATVGKNYLNRGSSAATYYGDVTQHDEAVTAKQHPIPNVSSEAAEDPADATLAYAPLCQLHSMRCARFVCKKRNANKGRAFFKCAHPRPYERCRFFKWADECDPPNSQGEENDDNPNASQPSVSSPTHSASESDDGV